jgi:hypothetical protein
MIDFETVFCDVDDVCQVFLPAWQRPLIIRGERRACRITPGHVDDRQLVPLLTQGLTGKRIVDRGDLLTHLRERGMHRITTIRKHRHHKLMPLMDKLLRR